MNNKKLQIGKLKIESPTAVAPMEAVNSEAFLRTCDHYGAGIINTQAIEKLEKQFYDLKKLKQKTNAKLSFQMMVKKPEEALTIAKEIEGDVDIIDFNFGCPIKRALGEKKGGYLLDFPNMLKKIIEPVINEVNKPITIKIRSGFNNERLTFLENGIMAQELGVSAITLHARTIRDAYTGTAKWNQIKDLKEKLDIPVIGNGDIFKAGQAKFHIERNECDGVMMGRAIKGNPGLFSEINQSLKAEKVTPISRQEQFNVFYKYYKEQEKQKLSQLKDHARWMTRSTQEAKNKTPNTSTTKLKQLIEEAKDEEEVLAIFENIN